MTIFSVALIMFVLKAYAEDQQKVVFVTKFSFVKNRLVNLV